MLPSYPVLVSHRELRPLVPFVEIAFQASVAGRQNCPRISIDLVARSNSLTCKIIHIRPETGPDLATEPALHPIRERLTRL